MMFEMYPLHVYKRSNALRLHSIVFSCSLSVSLSLSLCVSPSNADTLEITFNNVDLCVCMLSLLFVLLVLPYSITPTCMHEEKSGYSTTIRHRSKYHIAATRMKNSPISYFIWMKSNMWANAQISTKFCMFFFSSVSVALCADGRTFFCLRASRLKVPKIIFATFCTHCHDIIICWQFSLK